MSILRTYQREDSFRSDLEAQPTGQWPLYHLNVDLTVNKDLRDFAPGDWACHVNGSGTGRGIVVAVTEDEIAVLWSTCSQEVDDFSKFTFPSLRRSTTGPLIAKQLVSIQPMSVPSSAIFYLDYKYGNEETETVTPAPAQGPRLSKNRGRSPRRPGRPTRGPRKNP